MDENEKKPQTSADSRAPRDGDEESWTNWGQSLIDAVKLKNESGLNNWNLSEDERREINRIAGDICDPANTGRVDMWRMLKVSASIRDQYLENGRDFQAIKTGPFYGM